jgi:hypothetical protein
MQKNLLVEKVGSQARSVIVNIGNNIKKNFDMKLKLMSLIQLKC